jgi:Helix-turn-helix domain
MRQRGQTTTFQTRLEISEYATAGLNDTHIARVVGCSVWTVRKWRRRSLKLGCVGLRSQIGRPATGEVEYLSSRITGGHPSPAHAPSRLGTSHPVSCT